MSPTHHILPAAFLLLASTTHAQTSFSSIDLTFLTFPSQCPATDSQNSTNTPALTTQNVPTSDICLNLATLFSHPDVKYSSGASGFTCATTNCGLNYTLRNPEAYDPTANYSQILYSQSRNLPQTASSDGEDGKTTGALMLQTYNGENCLETPDGTEALPPWVQWDCLARGECSAVPYSVRSFAIRPVLAGSQGECVLGAVRGQTSGAARVVFTGSLGTLMVAFGVVAWLGLQ